MRDRRKVIIVSHTHWDREWYQPYQEYRLRLVKVVNKLLRIFEEDKGFRYFLMDGQTAALEDYLEACPQKRGVLGKLIRAGKIGVGPWYTQPDEFLSSPEALVRNLMLGSRLGAEYGSSMKIGYTPDSFGHIAQLPQILRGFGINSFVFTRGMGDEGEGLGTEFRWRAPDGTEVVALHLIAGYCNGAFIGSGIPLSGLYKPELWESGNTGLALYFRIYDVEPEVSIERAAERVEELMKVWLPRSKTNALLIMNGCDHLPPQESITRIIDGLRETMPEVDILHGRLEDYVSLVLEVAHELREYSGELRGARYHPLLPNVYSTRIRLKQMNCAAQTLMEQYAEPLSSIKWLCGGGYPRNLVWLAWKLILRNHAHDTICGCGVDGVYKEAEARFLQALQIAKGLTYEGLRHVGNLIDTSEGEDAEMYVVVYNPLSWPRSDVVSIRSTVAPGQYVIADPKGREEAAYVTGEGELWGEAAHRLVFVAREVPAMGYKVFRLKRIDDGAEPLRKPGLTVIENEFFRVKADPDHGGSLTVVDKRTGKVYEGLNTLIDEGDAGDEYNYSPPQEDKVFSSTDVRATITVEENPVYSTLDVRYDMAIPEGLEGQRRSGSLVDLPVHIKARLYRGVPRIDVETVVENRARDHRLRVIFPTGLKAEASYADGHYHVVRRPVQPPKGERWIERPSKDHPQLHWVDISDGAHGVTVANRGLPEYGADGDGVLHVTLLRGVGWLSRDDLLTRPGHAGPAMPTPDAQCLGEYVFEYSIIPHSGTWETGKTYKEARNYTTPLIAALTGKHKGHLPPEANLLSIKPDALLVTAIKRAEGEDALIVRFHNIMEREVEANVGLDLLSKIATVESVWKAKLSEEDLEGLELDEEGVVLPVRPWEIVTLKFKIREPSLPGKVSSDVLRVR